MRWYDDEDELDIRQHDRAQAADRLITLLTARVKALYDSPHDLEIIILEARVQLATAAVQGNLNLAAEMTEMIDSLVRER